MSSVSALCVMTCSAYSHRAHAQHEQLGGTSLPAAVQPLQRSPAPEPQRCNHGDQGSSATPGDGREPLLAHSPRHRQRGARRPNRHQTGSTANGQHVSLQPTGRRRRTYPSTKWREPPSGTATLADNMAARHTPNAAATVVAEWGYHTHSRHRLNRSSQPSTQPTANRWRRSTSGKPSTPGRSRRTPCRKDQRVDTTRKASNPLQTSRQHNKHHSGRLMSPATPRSNHTTGGHLAATAHRCNTHPHNTTHCSSRRSQQRQPPNSNRAHTDRSHLLLTQQPPQDNPVTQIAQNLQRLYRTRYTPYYPAPYDPATDPWTPPYTPRTQQQPR